VSPLRGEYKCKCTTVFPRFAGDTNAISDEWLIRSRGASPPHPQYLPRFARLTRHERLPIFDVERPRPAPRILSDISFHTFHVIMMRARARGRTDHGRLIFWRSTAKRNLRQNTNKYWGGRGATFGSLRLARASWRYALLCVLFLGSGLLHTPPSFAFAHSPTPYTRPVYGLRSLASPMTGGWGLPTPHAPPTPEKYPCFFSRSLCMSSVFVGAGSFWRALCFAKSRFPSRPPHPFSP